LHLAQCSQASTVLQATAKSRHVHRNWSLQRTRLHCSRVQWRCALHHCIRRSTTSWLTYCCSQLLPLCHNTTNS
ncbi:unnamed protein product, partial [Staurois parvus]